MSGKSENGEKWQHNGEGLKKEGKRGMEQEENDEEVCLC